ncbi:MAG: response regulator, partial [Flavobacteriales bacterium]
KEAIKIIDKQSLLPLKIESYKLTSLIALNENNFKKSEKYLSLYTQQKDSLTQQYINYLSKKTLEEKNIEDLNLIIEAQRAEILENIKSINLGKTTTGLSVALIIILSLLALSLFKNNNLRGKANDLLRDKTVELTFSKDRAERASIIKAQFLSTITHELRTPLYAVTGLTHLLLEEDPKPEQKEHLNSLKYSGEHLLSLINNILDLNKLEANKVEVEKIPFQLKKRINDVLMALKRTSQDKNNKLSFEYDESIPPKIIGDSLKLSQILMNLIGNSIKFTKNGEISVRAKKLKQTNNEVRIRIEIEDDGVGISKKKQKSIFETFSQGSLQINRKFGGSGLGLSIVKNLLEIMNSKIYLESEIGKGSKFWFDINFDITQTKDEDSTSNENSKDLSDLENKNILVVEDNKINQMITKKILEKNKIKCMVADNGTVAIEMVKKIKFDLVLMDIHMPGISGIVATQRIRTFNTNLPIIALTAVTIDENLDEFYNAGFNDIIPKPFKTEEFFEKIHNTFIKAKKN